jgi:ribosomal protein S14
MAGNIGYTQHPVKQTPTNASQMERPLTPPDQCQECGEDTYNTSGVCKWCLREMREQDRYEQDRDDR